MTKQEFPKEVAGKAGWISPSQRLVGLGGHKNLLLNLIPGRELRKHHKDLMTSKYHIMKLSAP